MGFGILFIGHLLLFFCKGVDVFPDVAAYAVIMYALHKLSRHAPGFKMAFRSLFVIMPLAAVNDALQIISAVRGSGFGAISTVATLITSAGMIVMYMLTLLGVRQLCAELGQKRIGDRALKCMILTAIYIVAMAIYQLRLDFMEDFNRYMGIIYLFLGLGWVILLGVTFYSCYMWICLEGDEDMPETNYGVFDRFFRNIRLKDGVGDAEAELRKEAAERIEAAKKQSENPPRVHSKKRKK